MKSNTPQRILPFTILLSLTLAISVAETRSEVKIPDTGQSHCYNNTRAVNCPAPGEPFFGQDAQYQGHQPAYRDNNNGTVTDNNTGLMWSKAVSPRKLGLDEAQTKAEKMTLGGYGDWRVPSIKELYSLIDFRGYTGSPSKRQINVVPSDAIPFINTDYFDFLYGPEGERYIDAQWLSSTQYVSTTMGNMETLFGVNFADGRIKGYGYKRLDDSWERKKFFVRYVRGTPYGKNHFVNNGDSTVTDQTTGLMWSRMDSARGMNWQNALAYAEQLELAGYGDWRLPNAKELEYIVDYSRSPDATDSAAINPLFQATSIINEAGEKDYPAYWTSTTHLDGPRPGTSAVYVTFGRAMGQMHGRTMDVHGAGAQRSDPKTGRAELGRGPQGDAVRVDNYVRVVRGDSVVASGGATEIDYDAYPYQVVLASDRPAEKSQSFRQNQPRSREIQPDFGRRNSADFSQRFVERLDRDGDGQVSRVEFDGPKERFGFHDTNGDGYLTADEAPKGPPPGGGRPLHGNQ